MNTCCRKVCKFYFRLLAACLTIFMFLGLEVYALDNYKGVISPYWQSDSTSYSFIAVTHPSLDDMASQIGVTLNAIQSDKAAFATAASFTISSGQTQRVFIVRTGHSIVNPTIVPSGVFIVGTTDYKYGNIIATPVDIYPYEYNNANIGAGFRDITMLSFFGGIVFDSNTTGFSMEFIGDTHDSETTVTWNPTVATGVN